MSPNHPPLSALGALWLGIATSIHPGTAAAARALEADVISGIVSGAKGPEAGVWVIAETSELGTRFAKIVVTDDQGRYALPELPRALRVITRPPTGTRC